MTTNLWRPLDEAPVRAWPWQVPCRAQQADGGDHVHECGREGDIGHVWHYCGAGDPVRLDTCRHDWRLEPPKCCDGTGYADHTAVPCTAPDCPIPTTAPTNGADK